MVENIHAPSSFGEDFEKEKREMLERKESNLLGAYSSYSYGKDSLDSNNDGELDFIEPFKATQTKLPISNDIMDFHPEKMTTIPSEQVDSYLKHIFTKADKYNATDIHIDELKNYSYIRYRVDGKLMIENSGYIIEHRVLAQRLKVMAEFFMREKEMVQKGSSFFHLSGNKKISFNLYSIPIHTGEKIVIKINGVNSRLKIDDIGMSKADLLTLQSILEKRSGLIVLSGLAGSGKTSTFYALIKRIRSLENNVLTIERRIFEEIEGVSQMEMGDNMEQTIELLKSVGEFDLDVIAVDVDYSENILKNLLSLALSGKLVIVTTYFPTAYDSIVGMTSMGTEPYTVAAALEGIIAQHLVRKLCPVCRGQKRIKKESGDVLCSNCSGLGYKGKTGVFEVIKMKREYWPLILKKENSDKLKFTIEKEKCSFENNCKRMVIDGITSVEEVIKLGIGKSILE